jgi:hypothetical protein
MKKVMVVLTMMVSLALVGTLHAQKEDTAVTAEAIAKGATANFAGLVKSIDATAKSMVVKTRKGDVTFMVQFARFQGEYKAVEDLKVGDKISGKATTVQGQNYATVITKALGRKIPIPAAPQETKKEVKPADKPADTLPPPGPAK